MRLTRKRLIGFGAVITAIGVSSTLFATNAFADSSAVGQDDVDALRDAALSTGAVVVVRDGDEIEQYGSGTTRQGVDDVPDADDKFRVASNSKMYVSTVLLQLVDEGKLDIDTPIGEYLPGLVAGDGIDENVITVRNLMQHTSGLGDNLTPDVIFDPTLQWNPPTPEEMVAKGTRSGSQFDPGSEWAYSNTGYTVLGLLIEKLTGQRVGDAIDERIVQPLGLEETEFAYPGEKEINGPHFSGYLGAPPLLFEVSGHEPGIWTAAGAMLSSGSDMTTFVDALVRGELMSADSLKEMQATFGDSHYGLGIGESETSCGTAWGHSGHVIGYMSFTYTDGAGKSVFVAYNTSALLSDPSQQVGTIINSALCGDDAGTADLDGSSDAEFANAAEAAQAYEDQK